MHQLMPATPGDTSSTRTLWAGDLMSFHLERDPWGRPLSKNTPAVALTDPRLFKNPAGGSQPSSSARNGRHACYGGVLDGHSENVQVCQGPVARGHVTSQETRTCAPTTASSPHNLQPVNRPAGVYPMSGLGHCSSTCHMPPTQRGGSRAHLQGP